MKIVFVSVRTFPAANECTRVQNDIQGRGVEQSRLFHQAAKNIADLATRMIKVIAAIAAIAFSAGWLWALTITSCSFRVIRNKSCPTLEGDIRVTVVAGQNHEIDPDQYPETQFV